MDGILIIVFGSLFVIGIGLAQSGCTLKSSSSRRSSGDAFTVGCMTLGRNI